MSGLILDPHGRTVHRKEFRLPQSEIPARLREDFAVNPHLEPKFYIAVAKAVNRSLNDPDTSVREITERTLKERIELCYEAVVTLRYELRYPLQRCFDLLAQKLVVAIRSGRRLEDLAAEGASDTAWTKESELQRMEVGTEDLNEDQSPCEDTKP